MKTAGFPISRKEHENRRAMVPQDVAKLSHPEALYFETGYGDVLGLTDDDYRRVGASVVSREEVLEKDIICDPKVGDAEYLSLLHRQTIFGWVHAVQNRDITDKIVSGQLTAYAWEDMFEKGRHIFWRNNELAGEAAIMHAFRCYGRMPYETTVAVIGRGNTARGAMRVLWDTSITDHIIYRDDLKRMKRDSMIVDVSCDRRGGIETSVPTTIEEPTYIADGVLHYAVDHTPALFYKTFTIENSRTIAPFVDMLVNDTCDDVLSAALIIKNGHILDERINRFQNRI